MKTINIESSGIGSSLLHKYHCYFKKNNLILVAWDLYKYIYEIIV